VSFRSPNAKPPLEFHGIGPFCQCEVNELHSAFAARRIKHSEGL
jgi:hypothetical protein